MPFEDVCPACFWERGTPLERPHFMTEIHWQLGIRASWNYHILKKIKRQK